MQEKIRASACIPKYAKSGGLKPLRPVISFPRDKSRGYSKRNSLMFFGGYYSKHLKRLCNHNKNNKYFQDIKYLGQL